jgi:FKBP-type peptidyl-prolyl cis-trans isomerase
MSIRPLDMQVLVPRVSQVSQQQQVANEKGNLDQSMASDMMERSVKKNNQKIVESNQKDKMNQKFDAKEKGSQDYQQNQKKKKNQQETTNQETKHNGRQGIDIRI